jgi:hypothetical protein
MNPPRQQTENHRKIIEETLVAIQRQEDILKHLATDLEYFRKRFKNNLNDDNGTGDYLTDLGTEETIDMRWDNSDLGNGTITAESAADFCLYRSAMENFELGVSKSKEVVEGIWNDVEVVRDDDRGAPGGWVRKDEVKVKEMWVKDVLEKGRRAAAQE